MLAIGNYHNHMRKILIHIWSFHPKQLMCEEQKVEVNALRALLRDLNTHLSSQWNLFSGEKGKINKSIKSMKRQTPNTWQQCLWGFSILHEVHEDSTQIFKQLTYIDAVLLPKSELHNWILDIASSNTYTRAHGKKKKKKNSRDVKSQGCSIGYPATSLFKAQLLTLIV